MISWDGRSFWAPPARFTFASRSPPVLRHFSLNGLLAEPMKRRIADPYAQCEELAGWDLYAVDGHYHRAECNCGASFAPIQRMA